MDTSNSAIFSSLDFIFDNPVGLEPLTLEQNYVLMKAIEKEIKPYLKYLGMKELTEYDSLWRYQRDTRYKNVRLVRVQYFSGVKVSIFLTQGGKWIYAERSGTPSIRMFSTGRQLIDFLGEVSIAFGWIVEGLVEVVGHACASMEQRLSDLSVVHLLLATWSLKSETVNMPKKNQS